MGDPTIAEAIEHTKLTIARLQAELIALENAAERMGNVRNPSIQTLPLRRLIEKAKRDDVKPGSHTAHAIEVLREAKKPLHVDDLIAQMEALGHPAPKASVVGALARHVTNRRIFYRPKPSVYGLLELKEA